MEPLSRARDEQSAAHSKEPTLIGEILPDFLRELAQGVPPAVAWEYRALADELELGEEEEAAA
jgi:hypothetical protein